MIRSCPLQPKGCHNSSLKVLQCACACVYKYNKCVRMYVWVWTIYMCRFLFLSYGCRALLSTCFKHRLYRRHVYKCLHSLFHQSYYDCIILTIIVQKENWTKNINKKEWTSCCRIFFKFQRILFIYHVHFPWLLMKIKHNEINTDN